MSNLSLIIASVCFFFSLSGSTGPSLKKQSLCSPEAIQWDRAIKVYGEQHSGKFLLKMTVFQESKKERQLTSNLRIELREIDNRKKYLTPIYYLRNADGSYFVTFDIPVEKLHDLYLFARIDYSPLRYIEIPFYLDRIEVEISKKLGPSH